MMIKVSSLCSFLHSHVTSTLLGSNIFLSTLRIANFTLFIGHAALSVSRGIALLFSRPFGTRRGWGVSPTPQPPLPPGTTQNPFYRRLGRSQGRSGRAENLVPTGIRTQTVQPVISVYTN